MRKQKKSTVGVFFGSRSPEHDVSIITACLVISGLKALGYNVVPIYIGKDGTWYVHDELGEIEFFQDKNYPMKLKSHGGWKLSLSVNKGVLVLEKRGLLKKSITIDIAFPALHGSNGEDGTIQGMFEMFNVPYVGCGVLASSLSMNKVMTKEFFEHAGIPTTKFVSFTKEQWRLHKVEIHTELNTLQYPLFVKPSGAGSSIGITKVSNANDLDVAIEVAFHYDEEILVEEGVLNMRDFTCSVIGHNTIEVSLVQESLYSQDMFSYDDKYIHDGGAQTGESKKGFSIPPLDIDEKILEKIQLLSKKIFSLFGCSGIARIDFLYDRDSKKLYTNEINPLPGTLYHHLWKESGVNLATLLERLILSAKEKYEAGDSITKTFNSGVLEKTLGAKFASKLTNN